MANVTALIITKNEELNIGECLASIQNFCSRIIVVDSGSVDKTVLLSKEMGADVYFHEFETHARQRNWALANCHIKTKWVLRLDADERLTPELITELEHLMAIHKDDDVNGITMEAWLYFLGKKIKHGCRNKRKLMLFKNEKAFIEDRRMDEHTILTEGKSVSAKNRFIHYDFKDMTNWINKLNWYATKEVDDYFDYKSGSMVCELGEDPKIKAIRKKKYGFYYRLPLFFRSWLLFIFNYIFKFGFLDGKEGFIYHWMYHRWYRLLVDAKILETTIKRKCTKTHE